jgi:hypothetical protein
MDLIRQLSFSFLSIKNTCIGGRGRAGQEQGRRVWSRKASPEAKCPKVFIRTGVRHHSSYSFIERGSSSICGRPSPMNCQLPELFCFTFF